MVDGICKPNIFKIVGATFASEAFLSFFSLLFFEDTKMKGTMLVECDVTGDPNLSYMISALP